MEKNEIVILIYTFTIILVAQGIFLLLFYFLFQKKQKTNKEKIVALNQAFLQTQIEIQEQTLKNVSQEIHDNVGQVLSLAKLNLFTLTKIADDDKQKLNDTKELVSKAINDLRDLTRSMHGEMIAEIGLQNAVDHELKILRNTRKFKTCLTVAGEPYRLQPQTQTVIFRILQEALHNDIKHSKAKNISVHFNYDVKAFVLTLKDDGIGFDTNKLNHAKTGIGLKSMESRASMIGGEFSINSFHNEGTTVTIKIPKEPGAQPPGKLL
ncbi:MAG: sensor histidine kinase [Ferruginibacter sp.]|nr:sensor histidine kinase [Ferruginibacter sp.]